MLASILYVLSLFIKRNKFHLASVFVISLAVTAITIYYLVTYVKNTSKITPDFYGPVVMPKNNGTLIHWWTSSPEQSLLTIN